MGKTNMKLFIIAAVLIASVCAEPESEAKADPWVTYAGAYGAYPYASTYAHAAYPYSGVYGAGVYGLGYNGYATGYGHYLGKRSADADSEAEAKPWLAYANYGYAGYPYASAYGLANPHLTTYSTAAYAYPYAATYGHYLGKRSADAEAEAKPEAWYGAYGYAGYGGYGRAYGYAGAYAPYSYGYRYASPYAWGYGK